MATGGQEMDGELSPAQWVGESWTGRARREELSCLRSSMVTAKVTWIPLQSVLSRHQSWSGS